MELNLTALAAVLFQELQLVQRSVRSYFRIGISTIGGTDLIVRQLLTKTD